MFLVLSVCIANAYLPNFLSNVKLQAYLSPPYHLSLKMFVLLWGWCGVSNEKVAGLHLQWEDTVLMFKCSKSLWLFPVILTQGHNCEMQPHPQLWKQVSGGGKQERIRLVLSFMTSSLFPSLFFLFLSKDWLKRRINMSERNGSWREGWGRRKTPGCFYFIFSI